MKFNYRNSRERCDVALVSLLLTLTYSTLFSSFFIVNFEQINVFGPSFELGLKKKITCTSILVLKLI